MQNRYFLLLVFLTFSVCSLSSSLDKSKKIKSFDSVNSPFFNFFYWIYWPFVSPHNAIFIKLLGEKRKKLGEGRAAETHSTDIILYILSHVNSFIARSLFCMCDLLLHHHLSYNDSSLYCGLVIQHLSCLKIVSQKLRYIFKGVKD